MLTPIVRAAPGACRRLPPLCAARRRADCRRRRFVRIGAVVRRRGPSIGFGTRRRAFGAGSCGCRADRAVRIATAVCRRVASIGFGALWRAFD
ncbi:hypothetical protein NX871_30660, partial [Burkholderia thailandensis]|uniref:hypothetical protein n=1 Tax=Burkholderia thailandensis TaxID=57975 RepID=UPI00217CE209